MFAKNKPTKKIDLDNNHWVEIQHLSKGTKDSLQSSITEVFNKFDSKMLDGKMEDVEFSPDFIKKVQGVEYRKLAAAIRAWSVEDPITIDTIKELDDESYETILEAVNDMNGLSDEEEKN
jgi:hypothetical protein